MFFKSLDSSFGQLNNKGGTLMELAISYCGAPGGSRTHDLWLRKPTLYPTELRAQVADYNKLA
jgi:hypothetical protein